MVPKAENPVLVYTMGKVGSSTVSDSVKKAGFPVFDIHTLDNERIQKILRTQKFDKIANHIFRSSVVLKDYQSELRNKDLKIISLIREPSERNLSGFFQNIENFNIVPNTKPHDIYEIFKKEYPHHVPIRWFDDELKKHAGIDVFEYNFDKKKRFLERDNLLVMDIDLQDEEKEKLLSRFLKPNLFSRIKFDIGKANVGSEKSYSQIYSQVKNLLVQDREYFQKMHASRFYRHFW